MTNTYVGLGDTPVQAFENYMLKLSGVTPTDETPIVGNQTRLDKEARIEKLEKIFADAGLQVARPTTISAPLEFKEADAVYVLESDLPETEATIKGFVERFAADGGRVLEWQKDTKINFGVLLQVDGITESHYISIEVGG